MNDGSITGWLGWALVSTLAYGINAFLFRRLIKYQGDSHVAMVISPSIVAIIAAAMLIPSSIPESGSSIWLLILFAALQGGLFFLTTESRAMALSLGMPSTQLYPIVKSGTLFVILISAFLFNELDLLTEPKRIFGIFLIIVSVIIILKWQKKESTEKSSTVNALAFALLATFTSIGAILAPKYVIEFQQEMNIFVFILIANLCTACLAYLRFEFTEPPAQISTKRESAITGLWLGVTSFAGFAAFLMAIKTGPLSIVAAINALYILIPIVLSVIFFNEPFRKRSQFAVVLSILGIVLCK